MASSSGFPSAWGSSVRAGETLRGGGAHRGLAFHLPVCGQGHWARRGATLGKASLQASKLTPNPSNLTVATLLWDQDCPSYRVVPRPSGWALLPVGNTFQSSLGPSSRHPSLIPKACPPGTLAAGHHLPQKFQGLGLPLLLRPPRGSAGQTPGFSGTPQTSPSPNTAAISGVWL